MAARPSAPAHAIPIGHVTSFGTSGFGSGQFHAPEGVAVSRGNISAAGYLNSRIARLSETAAAAGRDRRTDPGVAPLDHGVSLSTIPDDGAIGICRGMFRLQAEPRSAAMFQPEGGVTTDRLSVTALPRPIVVVPYG